MLSTHYDLPDNKTLSRNINHILNENQFIKGQATILSREPNAYATSFPSEIITCQLPDGTEIQLLCKYSAGFSHNAYTHRGGVAYEAEIYRQVLQQLTVPTPVLYGARGDERTGEAWIILQYFDEESRVKASNDHSTMQAAAQWLGSFHRENEALLFENPCKILKRYDAEYYFGWADRTAQFAGKRHNHYPWLDNMCKRYKERVDILLEKQENIIHGEYYPDNIIYYREEIYPVDWESAAIAAGELDLASLIEKWPQEISLDCISIYQSVRWPEGHPDDFEIKLSIAELYWLFRWLGDRPEWTQNEEAANRFGRLKDLGEEMDFI